MERVSVTPENTIFVVLSFEGPDLYSSAGGLGVRVTNLSQALADSGFTTHLLFVGAPGGKGEEAIKDGKLILHRWCQWISRYYPNGVYDGESEKLYDFNKSVPWFVAEYIVKPAVSQDKIVVVLGEEWHTAEAMCRLSDGLHLGGIRDKVVMFWNANNTFGFSRINWGRLSFTTTITTVSRYMKQIMRSIGVNPLVVPNGIPKSLLNRIDINASARLRGSLDADLMLAKVARWDPDKRWDAAVEAVARLKTGRRRTALLARGGIEPYGGEVLHMARSLGLVVKDVSASGETFEDYLRAIGNAGKADILNIKFHCPPEFLRVLYHASDAVLANSGHEPFGLVGLETMAAGGVAFTGGTGEDYAIPFHNAVVLETSSPQEIESYVLYLKEHPEDETRIRKAARGTARQFIWEHVIENLIGKIGYQARIQGLLAARREIPAQVQPAESQGEVVAEHEPALVNNGYSQARDPL